MLSSDLPRIPTLTLNVSLKLRCKILFAGSEGSRAGGVTFAFSMGEDLIPALAPAPAA